MIDLTKIQSRYKVSFEESYQHTGELDKSDPDFPLYYQIIAGKYGEIYSYNATNLAIYIIGSKRSQQVSRLKDIKRFRDGDGEAVCLFKADNLDLLYTVCRFIHAHKKKRVSETEKQRLKQLSLRYGFKKVQTTDRCIESKAVFTSVNESSQENKR